MADNLTIKRVHVNNNDYDIIDAVSTWTVAGLTRNLSNAGGTTSSEITAAQLKNALGITNAMHFIGITTNDLTDLSTTNPITINGNSVTAIDGDVVISGTKELVWANSKWNLMGDTGDFALKTITISGDGTEITGSGTLASDVTLGHAQHTAQNSGNTSEGARAVLNVVSNGYGHVTSVTSGTISATFAGTEATITSTASYKPAGTNTASSVSFTAHTTDSVLGANTGFSTTVNPTTTNIKATASGTAVNLNTSDFVTGVSPTTSKLSTTSVYGCGNNTTASHITSFSGGSVATFSQGHDDFTANVPTAIDVSEFNAGTLPTHGNDNFVAPTYGTDSFTPASIGTGFFSQGAFPSVTDSTWAFSVTDGTLSITGANSSHTGGTLPSIDTSKFNGGSYSHTGWDAGSFTQGTFTQGSLPSLGDGFYTEGSAASFTQGNDTFNGGSVATLAYDDVTAATKAASATTVATGSLASDGEGDSVVTGVTPTTGSAATGVQSVTQPTIALSTGATAGTGVISVATGITSAQTTADNTDLVDAITALGTGTAAAQQFTGTDATITSTATYTPAGTNTVKVTEVASA